MKTVVLNRSVVLSTWLLLGTLRSAYAQYDYYHPYYNFIRDDVVNPGFATFGYSIGYASYQDWQSDSNPCNPTITFDDAAQRFNGGYVWNRSTINFLNSTNGYGWSLYGNSTFNMRGGRLINNGSANGHIIGYQYSHITIRGGNLDDYLAATDYRTADITGGSIGSYLSVQGNSVVTMSGGTVSRAQSAEQGKFTFTGGIIGSDCSLRGDGIVHMTGGSIGGHLSLEGARCRAYLSGGTLGTINASYGKVYFSGGTVSGNINAQLTGSNGTIYFSGGRVSGDIKAWGDGIINNATSFA